MQSAFFKSLIFVATLLGFSSCTPKEIFFHYHSFVNSQWNQDDSVVFKVNIEDNAQIYDVSFELRNNDAYPYSNIWLFVDYQLPDGNSGTDTLGAIMADYSGKWLGKGVSLYNFSMAYKTSFFFPDTGTYIYSIRQGMPENPLKGISDIGLKVLKKTEE